MKCPNDNAQLLMTERQGVEIDYCPNCRGVWLDRGELDKLLERTSSFLPETPPQRSPAPHHVESRDRDHYRKKKRKSFLSDMFEFD